MSPALRKRPVSPARAAAILASPPDALPTQGLFGALAPEPGLGARLDLDVRVTR
ncbi:hypothetical protein ACFYN0_00975 [Streptomyces sp. NPDC006704]|uniref:hypothetical protein n=1 Tax=Streptomyces sp. NPDC006704 TaxID=3364760 RepID=UPI0036A986B5